MSPDKNVESLLISYKMLKSDRMRLVEAISFFQGTIAESQTSDNGSDIYNEDGFFSTILMHLKCFLVFKNVCVMFIRNCLIFEMITC